MCDKTWISFIVIPGRETAGSEQVKGQSIDLFNITHSLVLSSDINKSISPKEKKSSQILPTYLFTKPATFQSFSNLVITISDDTWK